MKEIKPKPPRAKRIKKEKVTPEQRNDWLERHDAGLTIKEIAAKDDYDVRTIRRHLDQAEQERERRDARLKVLQSALEKHYQDLSRFAEKINNRVKEEKKTSLSDERMWIALRQHIPRSPLWNYLRDWDEHIRERGTLQKQTNDHLRKVMASDSSINRFNTKNADSVAFLVMMLAYQMEAWARGQTGLDLRNDFSFETQGDGSTSVRYGPYFLNKVSKSESNELKSLIQKYEESIKRWDEYESFVVMYKELERLKVKIGDEIALITLRRVVPGKCLYCPL